MRFIVETHDPEIPANCKAAFHGAPGDCALPVTLDVIDPVTGEVHELCAEHGAPYARQAEDTGPPPEPDWDALADVPSSMSAPRHREPVGQLGLDWGA